MNEAAAKLDRVAESVESIVGALVRIEEADKIDTLAMRSYADQLLYDLKHEAERIERLNNHTDPQWKLVDAICRRMEAKPHTTDAVESIEEIEKLVIDEAIFHDIMQRIEQSEKIIRERDDSDVIHIG